MSVLKKLGFGSLVVLLCTCAVGVFAAPAPEYWSFWDKGDDTNASAIDHSQWDALLQRYAALPASGGIVDFRYADMAQDKPSRKQLDQYIDDLADLDPREYSRLEQKAYWMNLYNALSVQAVLENFKTLQASEFTQPLAPEAWDKARVKIARQKLSLNDIEHRILRPIWKDHRILFGLNCASRDCPNLAPRAFTAANIKEQLVAAGNSFINENSGVIYADGVLTASRLFQDYLTDFAADEKTLTKVFAHYAQDMKALYLLGYSGTINYTRDSRLNMPVN